MNIRIPSTSLQVGQIEVGEELNSTYAKIAWHKKVQAVSIVSVAFLLVTAVVKTVQIISQIFDNYYMDNITAVIDILILLLVVSNYFVFQQIFGLASARRALLEQRLVQV